MLMKVTRPSDSFGRTMDGHQGDVSLSLTRAEAQELLARLLLSHDDDNDLSADLMKRLARAIETSAPRAHSRCAA